MFHNFITIFKPSDQMGALYLSDYVSANNQMKLDSFQINTVVAVLKVPTAEYKPYQYLLKLHPKEIIKMKKTFEEGKMTGDTNSPEFKNAQEFLHDIEQFIKVIEIEDLDSSDISRYFIEASKFIHKKRKEKNNVLVHCYKGNS